MKKLLMIIATLFAFSSTAYAAININTATETELQAITGINAAKARAIIEYRTKAGGFRNKDDILNVPGITPSTVDIAPILKEISITGPTTLKNKNPAAK